MADSPPELIDLGPTYGAIFIGVLFCTMLFGITNLQVFWYYRTYLEDPIHMKAAVAWLWSLDALHIIFVAHSLYWYLVLNYITPLALLSIVWSFHLQIAINIMLIASVQTAYAVRLLKLNSGKCKAVLVLVATILTFAYTVSINECYQEFTVHDLAAINNIKKWTFLSLACIAIVDVLIAVTSCIVLAQRRTGFSKTDSVITTLMLYMLNTGLLTSLCSILSILMYAATPNSLVFLSIELVSSKLYLNSYLAMLNARNHLKAHGNPVRDVEASRTAVGEMDTAVLSISASTVVHSGKCGPGQSRVSESVVEICRR